jgi:DNA-binding MarR family transcriptional regulator
MIIVPRKEIPSDILKDSVLAHIAGAYFSVSKQLERKTKCSATRGFILSTLRGGVTLNQNQIATLLGLDRTVVHRSIKTMVNEGLVSEKKAKTGRAIQVSPTPKGARYRKRLIQARKSADAAVRKELSQKDHTTLVQLLKRIAELEL